MGAYQFHREVSATLAASPEVVFPLLDDPVRLAEHMGEGSAMLAGGKMRTETDKRLGQEVGSVIRMSGRILGMSFWLEEAVVERVPPQRKTWETLGEPKLLVIGRYHMGFELAQDGYGTRLRFWIDYNLPSSRRQRWLGRLFGRLYADWCVRKMAQSAAKAVKGVVR
jgi:hypothetical protein